MAERSIIALPGLVRAMEPDARKRMQRLYTIRVRTGRLGLPPEMLAAHPEYAEFREQEIVRVTNRWTGESVLFNALRARRPLETRSTREEDEIENTRGGDFCHPFTATPADTFGRIQGIHTITASNLAKYDYLHALILFQDHEPLVAEEEKIRDMLGVSSRWFERARRSDPEARYPFLMWNCLWRAGASVVHGHAQALLTPDPYRGLAEHYRTQALYRDRGHGNLWADIVTVHRALGLAVLRNGGALLAYLTPVKEKEVVIVGPGEECLPTLISAVLRTYFDLGVRSFNMGLLRPPLDEEGVWVARIVDRGDLSSRSSDIGGMELYGKTPVVASDPFRIIEGLRDHLKD